MLVFLRLTASEEIKILSRKIVSASISGSLFAILLGIVTPNPFGETIDTVPGYILLTASATPIYLMYSFPVILTYGVITSIISDELAKLISTKTGNEKSELIISGILHVIFGLVLLVYSLIASIIFFITDKVLRKKNKDYKWQHALKSLAIPITVFLIFMGIVWSGHILNGN
ncbi:hypothetical protein [Mesobacillus jeotgali]|uniref:hypothetical protein n=1 Tax=Mesobacillus jeotgali TaxID=129985 RepID=UPI001F2EE46B|nr:hypothetical protein [Mesobacillus jeotgali]